MIRIIIILLFLILFWAGCYLGTGSDEKNIKSFRSYPPEVKERLRKNENLAALIPSKTSASLTILSNIIIFVIVFGIIGVILKLTVGFKGFMDCFIYFLIFGEALNLFDLLIIDLLWWRNSERIRFSFIRDKALYMNPKAHISSFLRGIPTFAAVALIVAAILSLIK